MEVNDGIGSKEIKQLPNHGVQELEKKIANLLEENSVLKEMLIKIQTDLTKCVNESIEALNLKQNLKNATNDHVSVLLNKILLKSKIVKKVSDMKMHNFVDLQSSSEMQKIFN
jgi:hypothetical protein